MAKAKVSEYVMVAEAVEILGVSQGTIRTWAADGKIPMHKKVHSRIADLSSTVAFTSGVGGASFGSNSLEISTAISKYELSGTNVRIAMRFSVPARVS